MMHYDDLYYSGGSYGNLKSEFRHADRDDFLEGDSPEKILQNAIDYIQAILGCNCIDTEYKYGILMIFDGSRANGIHETYTDFVLHRDAVYDYDGNILEPEEDYAFPSENKSEWDLEEEFRVYTCWNCGEELEKNAEIELDDGHFYCERCAEYFTEVQREEKMCKKRSELEDLSFGAFPTVQTMDMGLQYRYFNSEGYGDTFGNIGQWPAIAFKGVTAELLQSLKERIKAGSLDSDCLTDTPFESFYDDFTAAHDDPNLNELFEKLLELPEDCNGTIYCLCDLLDWEPTCEFFTSEEQMKDAFELTYASDIDVYWSDMDEDELDEAYEEFIQNYEGFPIAFYPPQEDEDSEESSEEKE